jgi:outer membrane biosynthesis protein TonB
MKISPSPSIPENFTSGPIPPQSLKGKKLRRDPLGKALKISTTLHVLVLIFLIIKNWVFPSEPKFFAPSLRVDLVALPDTLKKDLPTAVTPSAPSTENSAPVPQSETKVQAKVEEAAPHEMVLHPKKAKNHSKEKTKQKEKPQDRDKKIKGALARIKALSKFSNADEKPATRPSQLIAGNQISKGTSLSGDAKENAITGYDQALRDRLVENWALPIWLSRQNLSAKVQLFLDARGYVKDYRFLKRSGSEQFDLAVRKTIEDSQPFPPPPDTIRAWILREGVTLGFPL